MRRPGFYFIRQDPDPWRSRGQTAVFECDGFICSHCGVAVWVKPMCDPADMGGRCSLCSDTKDPLKGLICKACQAKGNCDPFEEQLARVEAGRMMFTDIGK